MGVIKMTDKLRELLEDVQTVYEGKGMVVHPNSFDKLRMEIIKLDNINRLQIEQIEKMKCCENCKHHYFIGDELECHLLDNGISCDDKEKWEIKEK